MTPCRPRSRVPNGNCCKRRSRPLPLPRSASAKRARHWAGSAPGSPRSPGNTGWFCSLAALTRLPDGCGNGRQRRIVTTRSCAGLADAGPPRRGLRHARPCGSTRPEERVDLMNRLLPYMPLLLALSASSPFWQGRASGLAAYRLSAWGEMPRTGLPDLFAGGRGIRALRRDHGPCGRHRRREVPVVDLPPSIRFPTLELRVAR